MRSQYDAEPSTLTTSLTNEPPTVTSAERIQLLDVLRGFALCGILLANIHNFSGWFFREMFGVTVASDADNAVMWLMHLLVEGKFYSLFSLLFGVGFFIFLQRAEAKGAPAVPLFRRRLRWLLVIGLLHALLLWSGDILIVYALMGFLLVPFRNLSDRALLRCAAALLALPVLAYALMWAVGLNDPFAPSSRTASALTSDGFDPVQVMLTGWAGGYRDVLVANTLMLIGRWIDLVMTLRFPKVLGMFLIGFYVGRAGLARDLGANTPLFRRLLIAGTLIGLPANAYMAWVGERVPYLPASLAGLLVVIASGIGVPALALAYASGIALLIRRARAARILALLAPTGRMALTNYLMQSVACAFIFYGFGLGLTGRTGPAAASLIALAIVAAQMVVSWIWLSRYMYGPVEWVWRRLTYRVPVPLRRTRSPAAHGQATEPFPT